MSGQHIHLTVTLPSGGIAEVVAVNGEHEIHSDSIRVDGREVLMLIDGADRNAVEQAMWDARMALCFSGTNMMRADDGDSPCAGCPNASDADCRECDAENQPDGQPDEAQEWHDYDPDC